MSVQKTFTMTMREFRKIYGKSAIRAAWMHNLKRLSIFEMSSRKHLHKSNNATLEKFRLVLEQVPDSVFILDKDLNFEYINPYFTLLSGYTENDVLNKSLIDFIYEGKILESHTHLIETLRKGEKWHGTLLSIHRMGNSYWVNAIATPYKDEKGIVEGYIVIQQDISAQKSLEISLSESENLCRTLIEKSINGVALMQNAKIIMLNQSCCHLFGYTAEELKNLDPAELIAPADKARLTGIHFKHMQRELDSHGYTALFIHKSGKLLTIEINSTMVQVNGQNASFFTMTDISGQHALKEALDQSLQRFRELTEMLPQTVYEMDLKGIQTYLNQAGIKAFKHSASPVGRSVFDFISTEDHVQMKENMQKSLTENNFTTGNEYTGVRNDGTYFPIIVYGAPIFDKNKVVGTRGIIIDISERKAMENALRESESKYKTLVENSLNGITIIKNNKILFANNTFCKMLNYTTEELYNMPSVNTLHPSELKKALKVSERRKNLDSSTIKEVFLMVTREGEIKECETASTLIEFEGQMASFFTLNDITERARMQEALSKSEEKYRTLIEKAYDGIIIVQNGLFKFSNEAFCEMTGYTQKELIDKPFILLISDEDRQMMSDYHKRRMRGEQFQSIYRTHIVRNDGKTIIVEINSRTTEFNGERAVFVVIRDLTRRLQTEDDLFSTQKELKILNIDLERRIEDSSKKLNIAKTQLITLQKENLQSQFDVLKQQVNPHFLFNSLNVLTSLIKLEPDLAEKFSEHLSKVYRYVLENKDNELVDLNTELKFLDAYIFLLKIRFVNKLNVSIDIPEPKRSYQIIPLAMQLLIENAIKHNTMSKSNPLQIDIFIDKQNFLNIVNNLQERPSQIISTGVGLKNIQNRYLLLNNTIPVFEKTKTHFITKVPLVKND